MGNCVYNLKGLQLHVQLVGAHLATTMVFRNSLVSGFLGMSCLKNQGPLKTGIVSCGGLGMLLLKQSPLG